MSSAIDTLRRDFGGDIIEPGGAEYHTASRTPRDPDIVHARRIARRSGHPGPGRVQSSHNAAEPVPGR